MPDDLGSQNISGQDNSGLSQSTGPSMGQTGADPSSLTQPRGKSPLEEASQEPTELQSTQAPAPEATQPAAPDASIEQTTQSPLEKTNGAAGQPQTPPADLGETSQNPETDEFLKSIMEDQGNAGQAPTGEAPASVPPVEAAPPPAPAAEAPLPAAEAPSPPSEPVSAAEVPEAAQPGQTVEAVPPEEAVPAPQIKDEVGNLDGIVGAQPPAEAPQTAPPAGPEQPEQPAAPGAAPAPAKPKSNVKLLLIIAAVVLVIGGGWYVYSTFFAANQSVVSPTATSSVTPVPTPQPLTPDEQRKVDLLTIADALKNIMAGEKVYPVSDTMILLNDPNNVLTKALVPTYLAAMPQDPDTSKTYAYKSDGHTFTLTTVLDDKTDPEAVLQGGLYLFIVTQDTPTTTAAGSTTSQPATTSPTIPTGGSSAPATPDLDLPI